MTTYTKAELRDEVLENLGVLAAGQTANADDADKVERAIAAALEELENENIVPFDSQQINSVSNIPANVYWTLAEYVETFAAPAFAKPRDIGLRMDAMRRLRRAVLAQGSGNPTQIQNF